MLKDHLRSWDALFSSLAFAEKAAADECLKIANWFETNGDQTLSQEYKGLAEEELRHHQLALSVVKELVPITDRAKVIYDGGFFSKDATALERMASIHFVFEPSALAFLGFISSNSQDIFDDKEWAARVSETFNQILRDEVRHVYEGRTLIKILLETATEEERNIALKTMRKHRAFLKAGISSFFPNDVNKDLFLNPMLERFDFYYNKATKGYVDALSAETVA